MTPFLILLAAVAVLGRDDTRERVISILDAELPELSGGRRDEIAGKILEVVRK